MLSSNERKAWFFQPERDLNPDLFDASAMLYGLSYQELILMRVNDKPVDSVYMRLK